MATWAIWGLIGVAQATPDASVVRALSGRDAVSCATIEALVPDARAALEEVVDTVQMPPWAPMRAAQCLIDGHAAEVQPRLEAWVTDPALKGLGRLVLGSLDRLPVAVAVPVAQKALVGADPELATERVRAAVAPEVRALVTR